MPTHHYVLGHAHVLEQLFPDPRYADSKLGFKDYADVIRHYTLNSLKADGLAGIQDVRVVRDQGEYLVAIESEGPLSDLVTFGHRHAQIFSRHYGEKAIRGMELLKELGVWNPMEGYKVNNNAHDGTSKWTLFPPLGLNVMGQKGLLLLHYPPWAVLQMGTFENAITMKRWGTVLTAAGIPPGETSRYKTFIDVNPIAAPGSGESEYPNDYFPIMMASGFFHGPDERDYIRSMLELYLEPPGWPEERKYTLPLLICGSALYDPQAPGWFRVTYTDILPQDSDGVPQVNVMQYGTFKVRPDSKRETPYLIGNHMIAAGVTGRCTDDASKMPDIRLYEAEDMVAATFLKLYTDDPDMDPKTAKETACLRWFGNKEGTGAPAPSDPNDANLLCALAQMDLFFEATPWPHPKYSLQEGMERCKTNTIPNNPCAGPIKPPATPAE